MFSGYSPENKRCCFSFGYGPQNRPCCLKKIPCEQFDNLYEGYEEPWLEGRDVGEYHYCPKTAKEAEHMIYGEFIGNVIRLYEYFFVELFTLNKMLMKTINRIFFHY